jgi:hypothetical protein
VAVAVNLVLLAAYFWSAGGATNTYRIEAVDGIYRCSWMASGRSRPAASNTIAVVSRSDSIQEPGVCPAVTDQS